MFAVPQNSKRKVLSIVDLLYYLISKRVLWLKKQFVGMGSGEVRKGALEIKITRQGTLCLDPTSLKRKMSKRREEAASNIIPVDVQSCLLGCTAV
jgi:hypothetical protein